MLDWLVIGGAAVMRLPQLAQIASSKSIEGLSFLSFGVDLLAHALFFTFGMARRFPFSTFGENAVAVVEIYAIMIAMSMYATKEQGKEELWYWTILCGLMVLAIACVRDPIAVDLFVVVAIVLGSASKIPQIVLSYQLKSIGSLNVFTVFLSFVGSCIRLYTTATDLDDNAFLLVSFSIGAILSAVLLLECWKFGGRAPPIPSEKNINLEAVVV